MGAQDMKNFNQNLLGLLTMSHMPSWLGYSVGVLWTLQIELQFYILAALFCLALPVKIGLRTYLGIFLLAGTINVLGLKPALLRFHPLSDFMNKPIATYGMCLGIGVASLLFTELHSTQMILERTPRLIKISVLSICAAVYFRLCFSKSAPIEWWDKQLVITSILGAIMIVMCVNLPTINLLIPLALVGKISYSMYLIHALILDYGSPFFQFSGLAHWYVFYIDTTIVSVMSYFFIERPGIRIGRYIGSRFLQAK